MTYHRWTYQLSEYPEGTKSILDYVPKGDMTFEADWDNVINITYISEGLSFNQENDIKQVILQITKGNAIDSFPMINQSSSAVIGWKDKETGTVYKDEELMEMVPEKDMTFYAVWSEVYYITYESIEGYLYGTQSLTSASVFVEQGKTIGYNYPSYIFGGKEGSTIIGWSLLDGTVLYDNERLAKLNNGICISDYVPTDNITLKAVWSSANKITFEYGNAESTNWSQDYPNGVYMWNPVGISIKDYPILLNHDNKTIVGFTIKGDKSGTIYYTGDKQNDTNGIFSLIPDKDMILVAVWNEEEVKPCSHEKTELRNFKEATCLEEGYSGDTYCKDCNELIKTGEVTGKTEHLWDDGEITKKASCTEKGEIKYTCTREGCNGFKTEFIDAPGHTEETIPAVAATCTAKGSTAGKKCSVCNEILKAPEEVEALGHDWDEGEVTTPATCTVDGVRTFHCKRKDCDGTKTEPEKAKEHEFGNLIAKKAASCTEDGTEAHYECSVCHKQFVKENDEYVEKTSEQLVIKAKGHTEETIPAIAATCTTKGSTAGKKCSICGEILEAPEEVEALGHDWDEGEVTTPATCTEEGVRTFHCKRKDCDGTKTESEKATGHTIEIIPSISASCTHTGKTEGKKCKVCGEIIEAQKEIQATGHKWDGGKITKEPTETEKGIKTYTCSVCNETKTEEIPATGKRENPEPEQPKTVEQPGVGTISADGKILIDTDGTKYFVSTKLKANQIKKNISVADKKSNGKYKITKVIKKKGKIIGGSVTYMAPYNKNCTKATAGVTVKICGVKYNVTAINAKAFKDCKNLTAFTVGSNMTTIGKNAFNGCSSLKTFTIKSNKIKSIGIGAFKGTTVKTKFKVPKQKYDKYKKMILNAGANKKCFDK